MAGKGSDVTCFAALLLLLLPLPLLFSIITISYKGQKTLDIESVGTGTVF